MWVDHILRPNEPMSADQKTPNETKAGRDIPDGVDGARPPVRMVSLATDLVDDVESFSDAIDVCAYRRGRPATGDAS